MQPFDSAVDKYKSNWVTRLYENRSFTDASQSIRLA